MFLIEGLDHIALTVSDLNRSVEWYTNVLGLKRCHEAWSIPVVLCAGTTGIALFPADTSEPQPAPDLRLTKIMRHYAFRVSRASFAEAQAEFRRCGVEFEFSDHGISHSIYIYDPDEYRVELTTYEV